MHVPTHEDIHGNSQQIEYRTHACNLRQEIAGGGIQASPRAKLLLQEGIGRNRTTMAIERHEILGCEIARNRDGEREDKGIPVGCKRLARIAYVADAADICGKYRHAHHPARNGMAC